MFGVRRQTYKLDIFLPFPPQSVSKLGSNTQPPQVLHASFAYLFY